MLSSLHDFIEKLNHADELYHVDAMVNTRLEIAAIVRRISSYQSGGPAVLFLHPGGFPFPVVANLFGSPRRLRMALELNSLTELTDSFAAVLKTVPVDDISAIGTNLAANQQISAYKPVTILHGPCREELEPWGDLLRLPFLQNWPDDGAATGNGRYITLGQIFTSNPEGTDFNCGIYRCQIHDSSTLAIRWRPGSGAERHYQQFVSRSEKMPVAIVLGGPPALTLAAAWPLPDGLDELCFAGWLRGLAIPTVSCINGPLQVPAEADVVIEGFAEPDKPLIEGPFGNHTGQYDPAGNAARITVTRITRRERPVIPATVVGPPPQEDCWMMRGWERLLAALLPRLIPVVQEIRMPLPWVFRNSAIISVSEHSPSIVRDTVHALWHLPWFKKARLLIIVDASTSPGNLLQAAWRVVNEPEWLDDLIMDEAGGRLAVDATRRFGSELQTDAVTLSLVEQRWKEYGLP